MTKRNFLQPTENGWADPSPYDGPIQRADGRKSYNRYLWPMPGDWFRVTEIDDRWPSYYHFSVVGLADGRWSTSGFIHCIEENRDVYGRSPCVFPTREAALRHAVARFIPEIRRARTSTDRMFRLSEAQASRIIAWAMSTVGRDTPTLLPLPVVVPPPPPTGLPLLDYPS